MSQRRLRWGGDQDELLWRKYHTGEIDPHNNDGAYVFWWTQTYFPQFQGEGRQGRDRAIRRGRNKNRIRLHQLNEADLAEGRALTFVVFL